MRDLEWDLIGMLYHLSEADKAVGIQPARRQGEAPPLRRNARCPQEPRDSYAQHDGSCGEIFVRKGQSEGESSEGVYYL